MANANTAGQSNLSAAQFSPTRAPSTEDFSYHVWGGGPAPQLGVRGTSMAIGEEPAPDATEGFEAALPQQKGKKIMDRLSEFSKGMSKRGGGRDEGGGPPGPPVGGGSVGGGGGAAAEGAAEEVAANL